MYHPSIFLLQSGIPCLSGATHVVYYELFDKHLWIDDILIVASFFEKRPSCSYLEMLCTHINYDYQLLYPYAYLMIF